MAEESSAGGEGMKFGDLVVNHSASKTNPQKVLMVISATKKRLYCIARNGHNVNFGHDWQEHIERVGSEGFENWDEKIEWAKRMEARGRPI